MWPGAAGNLAAVFVTFALGPALNRFGPRPFITMGAASTYVRARHARRARRGAGDLLAYPARGGRGGHHARRIHARHRPLSRAAGSQ